jgi:hypothetical protein
VKNEAGLASWLGISSQSVYKAKSKGKIPANWFVEVAIRKKVSSDWLIFGEDPMERDRQAANTPTTAGEASIVSPDRYAALEAELRQERETTRELVAENRQLWKENGDLRVEVERLRARAAPDDQNSDELRQSA